MEAEVFAQVRLGSLESDSSDFGVGDLVFLSFVLTGVTEVTGGGSRLLLTGTLDLPGFLLLLVGFLDLEDFSLTAGCCSSPPSSNKESKSRLFSSADSSRGRSSGEREDFLFLLSFATIFCCSL